jgi:hypothetical protein
VRGHRDLRLLLALTLLCAAGSLIVPLGAARVIFAVPLALVLPGYAIAAAAFGSRLPAWPARLPLTLGVSLACLALGGLVLNYTPGGIRGLPWALLVSLVVLVACLIAARRRGPPDRKPSPVLRLRPSPASAIVGAGALALVAAALILAQRTVHSDQVFGFTQLWVAPSLPTVSKTQIGVTSEQQRRSGYRLVVEVDGQPGRLVKNFELEPGQTRTVTVGAGRSTPPIRLKARLYLRGNPHTVYRRVSTWLKSDRTL